MRCRAPLEKTSGRSVTAALGCSLGTFLLLFPANILPLIHIDLMGLQNQNVVGRGIELLWAHGWYALAGATGVMIIVLPFVRFGLLTAVLGALRFGARPGWLGPAFRWAVFLDQWALTDVFLLASFIGYYRLVNISQARVTIQTGGACFVAAAMLTMLSRASLDQRTVWRAICADEPAEPGRAYLSCMACDLIQPAECAGGRCPRCRARLDLRKPNSIPDTAALLIAAAALLFPAYLLPMNRSVQLGSVHSYTIFTGISDLFGAGLWPFAVVVFCTSFVFPVGKILVMGWCVLSVSCGWNRHLASKTKLLRVIGELGRWSNTDPLTIVFFVPLMAFEPLATADAGWGATAFMLMTVLTMAASGTFDPRLLWDAGEHG